MCYAHGQHLTLKGTHIRLLILTFLVFIHFFCLGGLYENAQDCLQHCAEHPHALRPRTRLEFRHDEGEVVVLASSSIKKKK